MSKHTYAANAPNEDRATLAVELDHEGNGYIFAGVWDGHAGTVTQVLADGGRAYSSSRDGTVRIWGVPAAAGAGAADATGESGA